jgi:pimeloyl-ACP methyl ester carboxylesterase
MPDFLTGPQGRIAYHLTAGVGTPVVFLGGFRSDMTGTKAVWLEDWARERGRPFLRFDYSGHGASDGAFSDGTIGAWLADARAALALFAEPAVLVGSSMGGWISLLIARAEPARVAGLVTVAAAPDFTDWAYRAILDPVALARDGAVAVPSDYGDPYVITRALIEDGDNHLILPHPLPLRMPVRLLQGTADAEVPVSLAQRLIDHAQGPDIRLTLVKDADHRFSSPACLTVIGQTLDALLPS